MCLNSSLQVDLYDPDVKDGWKQGFFMQPCDKKVLMKSDYLRKEAELLINYISHAEIVADNKFMCKSLKEINEGSLFLNSWVFDRTKELLDAGKLVGLLGGDHSTPLGFLKPSLKNMAISAFYRLMRTAICGKPMKGSNILMHPSCTMHWKRFRS